MPRGGVLGCIIGLVLLIVTLAVGKKLAAEDEIVIQKKHLEPSLDLPVVHHSGVIKIQRYDDNDIVCFVISNPETFSTRTQPNISCLKK